MLAMLVMFLSACAPTAAPAPVTNPAQPDGYISPYYITYRYQESDLTFDFNTSPRNDITLQFDPIQPPHTYANWYNLSSYPSGDASWGPHVVQFPAVTIPAAAASDSIAWQQERILRVAEKYIGTNYQHHHDPDWYPASDPNWPWQQVSLGHNSKGIDCSDFTSLIYNYGLGIKLTTAIEEQAATKTITGPGGAGTITALTITSQSYNDLINKLAPGDLLYIRESPNTKAAVSHVIMWIGKNSSSPDVPLIIDSHDNKPPFKDKNGIVVPAGVNIRPFEENGWYFQSFDHALRIIQ